MMSQKSLVARVPRLIWSLVFILIFMLGGNSCRTQKQPVLNDYILFGNGGGFAGKETTYKLLGNGSLLSKTSIKGDFTTVKEDINLKEVKGILKEVGKINWSGIELNNPGNTYRFLIYENEGITYKLTWGSGKSEVPQEIESLYNKLSNLAK